MVNTGPTLSPQVNDSDFMETTNSCESKGSPSFQDDGSFWEKSSEESAKEYPSPTSARMSFDFLCNSEPNKLPSFERGFSSDSLWYSPPVFAREFHVPPPSYSPILSHVSHLVPKTELGQGSQRNVPRFPRKIPLYNAGSKSPTTSEVSHRAERKIGKPKRAEKRKTWTKMTPDLFAKITSWEEGQKGIIKQSDIEKKWNVNRTTYYRWKQRRATANWMSEPKMVKFTRKEKI